MNQEKTSYEKEEMNQLAQWRRIVLRGRKTLVL